MDFIGIENLQGVLEVSQQQTYVQDQIFMENMQCNCNCNLYPSIRFYRRANQHDT